MAHLAFLPRLRSSKLAQRWTLAKKHLTTCLFAKMLRAMDAREELLAEIEAFIARVGMTETRFGELTKRDPSLILKIRRGRSVSIDTAKKLRDFMRDYRPPKSPMRTPRRSAAASAA
jgi:hypothetical protein